MRCNVFYPWYLRVQEIFLPYWKINLKRWKLNDVHLKNEVEFNETCLNNGKFPNYCHISICCQNYWCFQLYNATKYVRLFESYIPPSPSQQWYKNKYFTVPILITMYFNDGKKLPSILPSWSYEAHTKVMHIHTYIRVVR